MVCKIVLILVAQSKGNTLYFSKPKNEITCFFRLIIFYRLIFLPEPPKPQLRYKFKFKNPGLQGNEFEDCVTSKVDEVLEPTRLTGITTLKYDAI